MPTYRHGTEHDVPVLAQFWHDMLVESKVAGSGLVTDWRPRLERHFTEQMAEAAMAWFLAEEDGHVVGTAAAFLSHRVVQKARLCLQASIPRPRFDTSA